MVMLVQPGDVSGGVMLVSVSVFTMSGAVAVTIAS